MKRNEGSPSVNTVRSCGTPRTHAGNYMGNRRISRKNMEVMAELLMAKLGDRRKTRPPDGLAEEKTQRNLNPNLPWL